jgi:predicted  nucleic acid-binding Zn-ribbon protein
VNELSELQQQQTRHQAEQEDVVGKMEAQEQKVRSKEQELMQQVFKS